MKRGDSSAGYILGKVYVKWKASTRARRRFRNAAAALGLFQMKPLFILDELRIFRSNAGSAPHGFRSAAKTALCFFANGSPLF
jgi:hypothetical protein